MKTFRLFSCIALAAVFATINTHATTYTWTGTGFFGNQDFLWSNPYNWAELTAPQNGEQGVQLVFPNTAAPRQTTNDVINLVIKSVLFQGANYGIHGPVANGITMTLRGDNGGSFTIVGGANGCQFGDSTRLHFGSDGIIGVATGNALTIKSRLSGVFGFTKISPGKLVLDGSIANTYSGATSVLEGILESRRIALAIPGPLVIGTTDFSDAPIVRLNHDDQISDTTPVTVNANGKLELYGYDDMIGSLTLASGAVTMNNGLLTGTLTLNGNVTNKLGVGDDSGTISGFLSLGSTTRGFIVDAGTELVVNAKITAGTAGLVKSGPGRLTLTSSANDYPGATTVQAGTFALSGAAKPGSPANGTVVAQGAQLLLLNAAVNGEALSLNSTTNRTALAFAGTNLWSGPVTLTGDCLIEPVFAGYLDNEITFSGAISGTGSMRLTGWADVYFTGLSDNTFSGGYYGESGRTHFAKTASASSMSGPLFVGRAEDDWPAAHVIVETLNQIPNNSVVTLRNSGALSADANDTLGNVVFEGGTLHSMNGSFTLSGNVTNRISTNDLAGIYGITFLTAGQHVFDVEWLSILEVYGVLGGAGGIELQNGMLVLHEANTYAGLTHVASGTLRLDNKGCPGSSASGTIVDGLATLQLYGVAITNETLQLDPWSVYVPRISVFTTNIWKGPLILNTNADIHSFSESHLAFDGPISGPGGIIYHGDNWNAPDGTLVLEGSANNTYLGETRMLEGTLLLNKLNATAIPGNLIIGHETNGAPAASVYCLRNSQFAPVTIDNLNMLRVTINGSGGLHCGGHMQFIANILTRGGSVFTEGGMLYLHSGWKAETNASASHFFGTMSLAAPFPNHTHIFNVDSNASLLVWGDIGQGIFTANLEKQGKGELGMISSNSFDGTFTISDGRVLASGTKPFGAELGRTIVDYGSTLVAYSGTSAEPFTLSGYGFEKQGALVIPGSNYFDGPIILASPTDIVTPGPTNVVVFAGAISGPGGINKIGDGKVVLAGNNDNTYTGATVVHTGALELTKTNANAIRSALDIRTNGLVRYLRDAQLSDLTPVTISDGGQFRLLGHSDTIGSLAGFGVVELLDGTLITGNDNTATTYAGVISGIGGNLTKTGTNTFILAGNNAYTGTTFAKGGTLLVRGDQPWSDVTIQTSGTLGGTGRVGIISDLSGHVKPGVNSYGILKCAGFHTHNPANLFQVEINGTTPGVNCDQLDVTGGVTLMGGTLQVTMNFTGAVSNEYVIVKNDGNEPVTGSFAGLPQDAVLTANGVAFQINYHGGDGNDIILIQRSMAGVGPQLGGLKKLNDGGIEITAIGIPNAQYTVEATEDLNAPVQWTDIGTATANAQGAITFTDSDAVNHTTRFYRFRYEP